MEGLMTIGEVARVKKVTAKALRHYERIGILIPAYTDPQTGYRYYKKEQMLAVDMIRFLKILDIPLKDWNKYVDGDGKFDLKRLIEDGQKRAYEKIGELQVCLNRLRLASRGLEDTEKYAECQGFYQRRIPKRHILRKPFSALASGAAFHEKLSELFELAEGRHLSANYPSGLMADVSPEGISYFVYLEVYEPCAELPEYKEMPQGSYRCLRCPPKSIFRFQELCPEYVQAHGKFTVVEADCITSPLYFQEYPVELQLLVDRDI